MNINKKEAEVILILADVCILGEGQGTKDDSDFKLVLRILSEYPELSKQYGYMKKYIKEE